MKEIYIIRHGETEYNRLRLIQGSGIDADLNQTGIQQRNAFFEKYSHIDFEVVLTSKLKRTHQTVAPFIEKGISWEQWEEINEMNWGAHEGKKGTPEMRQEYANMIKEWQQENFDYSLPDAESANDLAKRIRRFVDHLPTRAEQKILICSHGRAMRCLLSVLKGKSLLDMENNKHSNTGLYKVIWDGSQFKVVLENDTSHLPQ